MKTNVIDPIEKIVNVEFSTLFPMWGYIIGSYTEKKLK